MIIDGAGRLDAQHQVGKVSYPGLAPTGLSGINEAIHKVTKAPDGPPPLWGYGMVDSHGGLPDGLRFSDRLLKFQQEFCFDILTELGLE